MSVTRLLVLGAVRIFQPAHGYLVRRELASWQVDQWANLNPGSVYNALRMLARDGMLAEDDTSPGAGPPGDARRTPGATGPAARARYRLTADGETEFLRLTRDALWQLHPYDPSWLLAGLSFWWALSRTEVLDALTARRAQLEARTAGIGYELQDSRRAQGRPEHVAEHFLLARSHLGAEAAWVDDVHRRITAGAYWFAGEPGGVPGGPGTERLGTARPGTARIGTEGPPLVDGAAVARIDFPPGVL